MNNWQAAIKDYYSRELETRKNWYTSIAAAYNDARPMYEKSLIKQALRLAQLNCTSTILEIGCGPGNATISFAERGYKMLCLEPNQDFYEFACQNCRLYPQVKFLNVALEEWEISPEQFDLVLGANVFHWIPPQVSYSKSAIALKPKGHLLLLWNLTPEPEYEDFQVLAEVYQEHAPSLMSYEGRENQAAILKSFGRNITNSGYFTNLQTETMVCQISYSASKYLRLLDTFSPYRNLHPDIKTALYTGLQRRIETEMGGEIRLSYLSTFHLAEKIEG